MSVAKVSAARRGGSLLPGFPTARLRRRMARASKFQQIGRMDPLIAGHAHALGLVCVTDNTRHFIRISGLTLENWLRP